MSCSSVLCAGLFMVALGATPGLSAQARPSLASQARVTKDSAQRLALARVPGGRVRSAELERENGALVWSFDIGVRGRTGIEEVQIDAVTGAVKSVVHETPAKEAAEAAADRRAAAAHHRKP